MTYYTVPKVTTTFYEVVIVSVLRTWKDLAGIPARTWDKLRELGLTTWKKMGVIEYVTVYYPVDKPSTTFYEVS